jgi:hypothetical protein
MVPIDWLTRESAIAIPRAMEAETGGVVIARPAQPASVLMQHTVPKKCLIIIGT